jgi:hypothetical protein
MADGVTPRYRAPQPLAVEQVDPLVPHLRSGCAQLAHEVPADEAARAGDVDAHAHMVTPPRAGRLLTARVDRHRPRHLGLVHGHQPGSSPTTTPHTFAPATA